MISLERSGTREQAAVDRVYDWRSVDHPATKESSVKTLNSILTTLYLIELEVNIALRVWVDRYVDDVSVLALRLLSNVIFQLLDPVIAFLPIDNVSAVSSRADRVGTYSSGSNML